MKFFNSSTLVTVGLALATPTLAQPTCGKLSGYDRGIKAFYFYGEAEFANFVSCSAACKGNEKCASFAFGNSSCLLYDQPLDANFREQSNSPFIFFDRECIDLKPTFATAAPSPTPAPPAPSPTPPPPSPTPPTAPSNAPSQPAAPAPPVSTGAVNNAPPAQSSPSDSNPGAAGVPNKGPGSATATGPNAPTTVPLGVSLGVSSMTLDSGGGEASPTSGSDSGSGSGPNSGLNSVSNPSITALSSASMTLLSGSRSGSTATTAGAQPSSPSDGSSGQDSEGSGSSSSSSSSGGSRLQVIERGGLVSFVLVSCSVMIWVFV